MHRSEHDLYTELSPPLVASLCSSPTLSASQPSCSLDQFARGSLQAYFTTSFMRRSFDRRRQSKSNIDVYLNLDFTDQGVSLNSMLISTCVTFRSKRYHCDTDSQLTSDIRIGDLCLSIRV